MTSTGPYDAPGAPGLPIGGPRGPIAENQLRNLFDAAREKLSAASLESPSQAVADALDDVMKQVEQAGVDPYARHQLRHLFDALRTVLDRATRALPPSEDKQAGTAVQAQIDGAQGGKALSKFKPRKPEWFPGGDPRAGQPYKGAVSPDRLQLRRRASADAVDHALAAIREVLADVEVAFNQPPPLVEPPSRPWYQDDDRLVEIIQTLIRERRRERAEGAWEAVDWLQSALRSAGVEIVDYDPGPGLDQPADMFVLEDTSEEPGGFFETEIPALVATDAAGGRRILRPGRARRLQSGPPEGTVTAGPEAEVPVPAAPVPAEPEPEPAVPMPTASMPIVPEPTVSIPTVPEPGGEEPAGRDDPAAAEGEDA